MFEEEPLEVLLACVDRELGFRARVYPRWVSALPPKMKPAQAEQELARMRAVRARLVRGAAWERACREIYEECGELEGLPAKIAELERLVLEDLERARALG